jgi:response regulator RpfG family c-di-GMP phosphodiesterase
MTQHKLLFVDDEQGVLDSLERVFLDGGYHTETATSPKEALNKLGSDNFSLILSDQRMPEMTGAEFLEKAKESSPDTIRILLTGYSDIKDAAAAINKGHIYRYLNKPWKDDELRLIVKEALRHYDLVVENRELHALIKEQNRALKEINVTLDQKVKERTAQLEEKSGELEESFIAAVRVFTRLVSQYDDRLGNHCKRVSVLARRLAQTMNLPEKQVLDIEIASLLHDIGAIGLPKILFCKNRSELGKRELHELERHPVIGQEAFMAIKRLEHVGTIIRHHHERYDGRGYPDGLAGEEIPMGARMIAIVDSYDLKANPQGYFHEASPQAGITYLKNLAGFAFDPVAANAFLDLLEEIQGINLGEVGLPLSKLKEGMMLSRSLFTKRGKLLLGRGSVINGEELEKIRNFHAADPIVDRVYVSRKYAEQQLRDHKEQK